MDTYKNRFFLGLTVLAIFTLYFWMTGPSLKTVLSHYDKASGTVEQIFVAAHHTKKVKKINDFNTSWGLQDIVKADELSDELRNSFINIWLDNHLFAFDTITNFSTSYWLNNKSEFSFTDDFTYNYPMKNGDEVPVLIYEKRTPHVIIKLKDNDKLFAFMLTRQSGSYFEAATKAKDILSSLKPGNDVEIYFSHYQNEADSTFNIPSLEFFYQVYKNKKLILEEPVIHEMARLEPKFIDGTISLVPKKNMTLWYQNKIYIVGSLFMGFLVLLSGMNFLKEKGKRGKFKLEFNIKDGNLLVEGLQKFPLEHLSVDVYMKKGTENIYGICLNNQLKEEILFLSYRFYRTKIAYEELREKLNNEKVNLKYFSSSFEGTYYYSFKFEDGTGIKFINKTTQEQNPF